MARPVKEGRLAETTRIHHIDMRCSSRRGQWTGVVSPRIVTRRMVLPGFVSKVTSRMKVQQFLEHHGLTQNPFSQEDAQSDPLFKAHCSRDVFHPAWDKIFGSPSEPATSVVFGEKGSGKTALRLQIVEQIAEYNRQHPDQRVYVVQYDDFNPFLDCFHERMSMLGRSPERTLSRFRLWDHMDALLSLAVTQLMNDILQDRTGTTPGPFEVHAEKLARLSRTEKRDLLLLATYYDRSTGLSRGERWNQLRRRLRFDNWRAYWDLALGVVGTLLLLAILYDQQALSQLGRVWPWLTLLVLWGPWLIRQARLLWHAWNVSRQVKVVDHPLSTLRTLLARFESRDLLGQPAPSRERSDDRYELLSKLQSVLKSLGFTSMLVLVDRVDEPHLINGSASRMRDLLWPMFDNKFLKHAGLGFKLLLPIEVSYYLLKEDKEFYERSRLDKQNLIRSLEWTGESLYDLANDRMRASANGRVSAQATLRDWFEDSITEAELVSTLARLRVPRHLFKFIHRLLVDHCNRYTEGNPRWKIGRETLHATLAVYLRDLEAHDRGMGTG